MNTKATTNYGIVFATAGDAVLAQKNLFYIAKIYGNACLADLKESVGLVGDYEDTNVRWTPSEIGNARINRESNGKFSIRFPVHDSSDDSESDETINTDDEPHPIYINVTTTDMDDPDCLICSVLTHAQKIRDRDIFINVY